MPQKIITELDHNIDSLDDSYPLLRYGFDGCDTEQAYVVIRSDGRITYFVNQVGNNSWSDDVWNKVILLIRLPSYLSKNGVYQLHKWMTPNLIRIVDGLGAKRSGSTWIGTLTADAESAFNGLVAIAEGGGFNDFEQEGEDEEDGEDDEYDLEDDGGF